MSAGINLNEADREMFQFAQMIAKDDQNAGIRLMYDYWAMVDRFKYIRIVFGSPMMKFRFEDIPYIFALDHICEELYDSMTYLLGGSSPFIRSNSGTDAVEVSQELDNLLGNLAKFKKIRTSSGWESTYQEASNIAAAIISGIKMLGIYHNTRRTARVSTSLKDAEEFFSSKVNFQSKTGKYLMRGD